MEKQSVYCFKEIDTEEDLEFFMKIRYKAFKEKPLSNFLQLNEHKIDINIYDLHSRHFGVYGYNGEPVGYVRVVFHKEKFYNDFSFSIGEKYGFFNNETYCNKNLKTLTYPDFPFISYLGTPDAIQSYYLSLKEERTNVVECSRIIILKKEKDLFRFLVDCILSVQYCYGKNFLPIVNCDAQYKMFYEQYGFETIKNGAHYYIKEMKDVPVSVLSLNEVPKGFHKKIQKMLQEFIESKQILFKK